MTQEATAMATPKSRLATQTRDILTNLYELVEALDRRVPQLERIGEAQIAHDAAELRERAMSLIHSTEADAPME